MGAAQSGLGPDFAAKAVWADAECREIDLTYWNRIEGVDRFPDKPRVGDWFVITDAPGECGNAVLGAARCLRYFMQPESAGIRVQLSVFMMGVSRRTGDAIVRSIAVYIDRSSVPTVLILRTGRGPRGLEEVVSLNQAPDDETSRTPNRAGSPAYGTTSQKPQDVSSPSRSAKADV
jgi:hypothetical protein